MVVSSLYRRDLPSPPAIEFASPEGKRLFTEALGDGTMEGFFKLISYYQTQSEPAYCGLATISMVLNALAIDPGRKWKGPWRWFDDLMLLDCCEPPEKVKSEGITFGEVACLARCNGAKVEALRTNESTVDEFRQCVVSCSTSEDCHVIASYHRAVLKQTGTGHFSPIGGYHSGRDMVLILDVARFKYPPHWVPLTLLWDAMNIIDEVTGHHRGYMMISKLNRVPSILHIMEEILQLVRENEVFKHVSRWLPSESSLCLGIESSGDDNALLEISEKLCCHRTQILAGKLCLADIVCCRQTNFKTLRSDGERPLTVVSRSVMTNRTEKGVVIDILESSYSTRPTSLCAFDQGNCWSMHSSTGDILTLLFLALPEQTWSNIKEKKLREEIIGLITTEYLPTSLQEEVLCLRRHIHFLMTDLGAP